MSDNPDDKLVVEILQAYLKIESVVEETDYADCLKFAKCLACSAGLEFSTICLDNTPIGVAKWPGTDSKAKSIVLNTHMNVWPVREELWDHPPFAGEVDESGNIYGRGSQGSKMMAIQYIEAIKRIKKEGGTSKRTIVVLFMPSQGVVDVQRMKCFFKSDDIKALNIGVWFDYAAPSPCKKAFSCFYAEKHMIDVEFHIKGSSFIRYINGPDAVMEKVSQIITPIYEYRKCQLEQAKGLIECPDHVSINVVDVVGPPFGHFLTDSCIVKVIAFLPIGYEIEDFRKLLKGWACKVEGCCLKENLMEKIDKPTDINNPFYKAIQETAHEMNFDLQTRVNPNASMARFARNACIPAFGFSCLNGVTLPLHGENEYIETDKFLRGIDFYTTLLPKLSDLSDC